MSIAVHRPPIPDLDPAARASLPTRRPRALRRLAGWAAAAVMFVGVVLVHDFEGATPTRPADRAITFGVFLIPWLLAFPWLKALDLRPVPWFFGCLFLGFVASPILAWKVAYRGTSLPYRDWTVEYWHDRQARMSHPDRAIVLVAPSGSAAVYPRWVERLELVQRIGWAVMMVLVPSSILFDEYFPEELGAPFFFSLIALMLSHLLVAGALSPRLRRWTKQRRLA